ncbi:ubiquitin-conjugating enzyme E2 G1 [Patagioenas fasciata monilis]|uniref:Ubiquitin-conjugating enzyme E2 G1 n=1 Tax=Patagioenas fasciata monilis TaxID=372326 RepID=A0A1V4K4H2_PATFA|nr:ubiquitin-conjugating enzyme E2 G1 [Patagioenas fasciata monilis]
MTELQSALLLRRQLAELNKNPVEGFSAGLIDDNDLYRWEVLIIGPPDTLYEGGVFKAHLTFPKDYPLRPPKMKFITEIWHPNVDKNGDVCISILHEPGEDKYGYEKPEERWLPIHTVETIMISVISMLADPNGDSPANVDAAKEWREDRNGEFKRKVARCLVASLFSGSPNEKHGTVFFLHSTHLLLDFCCYKLANTGWNWAAIKHASYQC